MSASDGIDDATAVKCLISQMCESFYNKGWATGTSGGVSIRIGGPTSDNSTAPWRVFVAPSGIQKEDMIGEDIFEMDMDQNIVQKPVTEGLRLSACTPLWYLVYKNRPSAKCVIHTHSLNAQMATLLDPTEQSDVFRVTHLEMLKGVGKHSYDDVLEVPIIDNRPTEDMLSDQMEAAIQKYPKCNAVLVRRHGIFCWGDSWEQAKTQLESFDNLFESAIKMRQVGIDFSVIPKVGTYRSVEGTNGNGSAAQDKDGRVSKKRKVDEVQASAATTAASGFNGMSDINNAADLVRGENDVPLLPGDAKILLLDIEGCTTSISFVKDVLFPFVLENLDSYVSSISDELVEKYLTKIKSDIEVIKDGDVKDKCSAAGSGMVADKEKLKAYVRQMVACDVKATGLKALQGDMWKSGYESGELKGHIYPDFKPMLEWCKVNGVQVSIYSSGSIKAQKLLFGHTSGGDLLPYLTSYFDTTSGGKKEAASYKNIANSMGVSPSEIVFVSDAEAELVAAREAGIGHPVMSIRPGNAVLTGVGKTFPKIFSLMQLCGF